MSFGLLRRNGEHDDDAPMIGTGGRSPTEAFIGACQCREHFERTSKHIDLVEIAMTVVRGVELMHVEDDAGGRVSFEFYRRSEARSHTTNINQSSMVNGEGGEKSAMARLTNAYR